jgi:hypothetical protein
MRGAPNADGENADAPANEDAATDNWSDIENLDEHGHSTDHDECGDGQKFVVEEQADDLPAYDA